MALSPRQLAAIIQKRTTRELKAVAPYQSYVGAFFGDTFQGSYTGPGDIFEIADVTVGKLRKFDEDVAMSTDRFGSSLLSFKANHRVYKQLRITELEQLSTDVNLRKRFVDAYTAESGATVDEYLLSLIYGAPINALGEQDIATDTDAALTLLEDMIETYDYAQADSEASATGLTLLAPPEFIRAILKSDAFTQTEAGVQRLFAGEVGTFQGVRVIKSKRTIEGTGSSRKATLILANGSLGGEKVVDVQSNVTIGQDVHFDGDFLRLKTQFGGIVVDPNRYVTAEIPVSASKRVERTWDVTIAPRTQTPWGTVPETSSVGAFTPGGEMSAVPGKPANVIPTNAELAEDVQDDLTWGAAGVDVDGDGTVGDK